MTTQSAITGNTTVYGIIGWPIKHSLSPLMQNKAFSAAGLDAVFVPFAVEPKKLPEAVLGLRSLGVAGFNVTIPHKAAIVPLLDELDQTARLAGAVNVVKNSNGKLIGFNTDGDGLVRSLEHDLGCHPAGRRVLLVGAGGAARGALVSLCRAGAAEVCILNRSAGKAAELIASCTASDMQTKCSLFDASLADQHFWNRQELIINATSLGMNGEDIPQLKIEALPATASVYDMVYAPPQTVLLQKAAQRGLKTANGLGMLAAQGELAFRIWTGVMPRSGLMLKTLTDFFVLQ
ncbi:MAG: shikimate dehydrogenase [Trichlorobacter sp.]|nr:shikimate dehydrogenase [Trichlorobacter sp.]